MIGQRSEASFSPFLTENNTPALKRRVREEIIQDDILDGRVKSQPAINGTLRSGTAHLKFKAFAFLYVQDDDAGAKFGFDLLLGCRVSHDDALICSEFDATGTIPFAGPCQV